MMIKIIYNEMKFEYYFSSFYLFILFHAYFNALKTIVANYLFIYYLEKL